MTERMIPENVQNILHDSRQKYGLMIDKGRVRRTSSRFCLGVEHGDYNGTSLLGLGTDRFIFLCYKPNRTGRVRIYSANFPQEGLIEWELGHTPPPGEPRLAHSWSRYPLGADYILHKNGYTLRQGFDGVIYGNIPGGGMSRSASLTLNLLLTLFEVNAITEENQFRIVELAQAVENEYVGSPCGQLDQIMILFARENMATHYHPASREITHIPLGPTEKARQLRVVVMDTGTVRPGLENSTYKIRRTECEQFGRFLHQNGYPIKQLGDIKEEAMYQEILQRYSGPHPDWCDRLRYLFPAGQRFEKMLAAWQNGDVFTLGQLFREDGLGLRDYYQISGPELETMCDIVRVLPGVLGERMLGGGDKGAAGALVLEESLDSLQKSISIAYPRSHPEFADKYAIHVCRNVDGVIAFEY